MADPRIRYDIVANAQGADSVDRLATELAKLDSAFDPDVAARAQALAEQLRKLGAEQAAVDTFVALKRETNAAREALDQAQAAAQAFAKELAATETPSRAQTGQMQKLADAVRQAKAGLLEETSALDLARGKLATFGIATDEVAAKSIQLRDAMRSIEGGTSELESRISSLRQAADAEQALADTRIAADRAVAAEEQRLADIVAASHREMAEAGRLELAAEEQAYTEAIALQKRLGTESQQAARAAVENFNSLSAAADKAQAAFLKADAAYEQYRKELQQGAPIAAHETQELEAMAAKAREAAIAFQRLSLEQSEAGAALRATGVDTDKLVASQTRARQQMTATAEAAQQVAAGYRAGGAAASASGAQQVAANTRAAASLEGIRSSLDGIRNLGVAGILGSQTAQLLKGVAETADAYDNLRARIKLVTGDGEPLRAAFEGVYQVALRTNSTLEGTGTLFSRIAQAGKEIGVSQAEALQLTESINQAIQLSGGAAGAADAAVTQLIQGLQSGVLRGEEFNSVMEQAPRLAQALAAGLGVTTGELRKLANEGELTSATVIRALQGQASVLRGEFQTLPATVGRAVQNLRTEWERLVGTFNDSTGTSALVADGINKIAANLDTIARLATEAGAALLAALAIKGVAALRAMTAEASLTTATMKALGTSIAAIPTVVNVAIAVVGFEIGFKIGEMLRENSALARTLGVGITEFLTGLVNDLQFVKDAAAAVFTDDTISASFDRYKARAEEQRAIFQGMYDDAKKSPAEIAAAADAAAEAARSVGAGAAEAAQQVRDAAIGAAGSYSGLTAAAGGAATAVQQVGEGAGAAGAQIAAGGAAGAAGLQPITAGAKEAQGAILDLATVAKVQMPTIGVTAAAQATILADVAGKSRAVADVIRTELPAAISKLSGAGLEQFRAAFAAAFESSIRDSRRLAESLEAAGKSGEAALAAAQAKGALLQAVLVETGKRAAEALGVDVAGLATGLGAEFRKAEDNLAVLIRSMPALKAAGVDAGNAVAIAIGKMIDGAKSQAELDAILDRLKALESQGVLGPQAVAGAFQQAADKALTLKTAIEDATPGIQSLSEAARKAGVDIGELTTGIKRDFALSVADVDRLADRIQAAGISAERAGPLLKTALDQRIAAANTKEELALVSKAIEDIIARSPALAAQLGGALKEVALKAAELSPVIKQARADAELLGITLKDKIGASADGGVQAALQAYERLKTGGKASASELDAAFVSVAKTAIAAAGGIVPEWVKVEAASRSAKVSVDEYGNAIIEAANQGSAALNQLAGSFDAAAAAATKARNESVKSVLGTNTYDKQGFATDSNGQRIVSNSQANVPQGSSFDQQKFQRDADIAARTGFKPPDPNDPRYIINNNSYTVPAYAPPPAPAPASSSGGYQVTVVIGGKTYGIGAASKSDADRIIESLEEAYRAGGGG